MAELISSISFHENQLTWLLAQADVNQTIDIKRVVDAPLPFTINYDNLQRPTAILEVANHLKNLVQTHNLPTTNIRFLMPTRFGLVKKVLFDQYTPEHAYKQLIRQELSESLLSPTDDYLFYYPAYSREYDFLEERMVVAVRKSVFGFFRDIGIAADMNVTQINLNTFAIDDLYRRFFPAMLGESMLVNFAEHGMDITISGQRSFLNYYFRPYSKSFQKIDELTDSDIADQFAAIVEDIQRPGSADFPLFSISQIFLFGKYYRPSLRKALPLDHLPTIRTLDPLDVVDWQIILADSRLEKAAYQYIEPLANLF